MYNHSIYAQHIYKYRKSGKQIGPRVMKHNNHNHYNHNNIMQLQGDPLMLNIKCKK